MWELSINGVDFYHIANWFYIYSFLGWLWETCYVSVRKGKLINRGFINGPLCTIYGCGALAVYLILLPVSGDLLLLFVGGVVVATAFVFVTSALMENIFHTSWWDYSDKKFNFQGRICLGCSLGWGLFTVGLFRVLHPVVSDFVELYSRKTGEIAVCVVTVVYIVDFAFSAAAAFHIHERIPAWEQALDQMRVELLVQAREKMENLEESSGLSRERIKKQLESKLGRLDDVALIKELEEKNIIAQNQLKDTQSSYDRTKVEYERLEQELEDLNSKMDALRISGQEQAIRKQQLEGQINVLKEQINTEKSNAEHLSSLIQSMDKEMEEKREQIGQYQKEHEDLTVQARESLKRQEEAEKAVQDADEKRMLLDQQVEEQKQTIIQTLNEKADLTAKKQRYETMLEQVLVRRSEVAQKLLKSKSDESVQEEQRKEEEKHLREL